MEVAEARSGFIRFYLHDDHLNMEWIAEGREVLR